MITIKHKEFKEKLAELINTSELPAFVMVYVLEDCKHALSIIAEQQLQKDLKENEDGTN